MKIIYAHNYYQQPGGEDQSYRATTALLETYGHEVVPFTRDNAAIYEMNPISAATRPVWSREAYRALDALIRRSQPDLVHFHNTFMLISPAAYYAAKAHGLPVVQDLRNYRLLCPVGTFFRDGQVCEDCLGKSVAWPGVLHACWRDSRAQTSVVTGMLATHRALGTWHRQVDRYIVLTEFARAKFIAGGLPAERLAIKPNFIDGVERGRAKRENFALFVGRLDGQKGLLPLLDAWRRVEKLPLRIVGDGPLREALQARLAAEPQLNVEWLGRRPHEEVLNLMARARLLVFPSLSYEGMPNTIIEAFASGTPVLASRLGAMAEMIQDGQNGLLFAPGDPSGIAAKVGWAQAHADKLARIGGRGRKSYETLYTPERNYEQLMAIYAAAQKQAVRS